jgi:hypothetical protein
MMSSPCVLSLLEEIESFDNRMLHAPLEQLEALMAERGKALQSLNEATSREIPAELLAPLFAGIQRLMLSSQRVAARLGNLRNEAISELSQDQQLHRVLTHYGSSRPGAPLY